MGDGKKAESPMTNPFAWILRASIMLLGATIALNLAVTFIRPIMPWIIGGLALAVTAWAVVGLIRWRRSRW